MKTNIDCNIFYPMYKDIKFTTESIDKLDIFGIPFDWNICKEVAWLLILRKCDMYA